MLQNGKTLQSWCDTIQNVRCYAACHASHILLMVSSHAVIIIIIIITSLAPISSKIELSGATKPRD